MTEYIGRSGYEGKNDMRNTPIGEKGWLGNPHPTKHERECPYCNEEHTVAEAVRLFRREFHQRIENDPEFRTAVEELKGETLDCPCTHDRCHEEVINEWLGDNRSVFDY